MQILREIARGRSHDAPPASSSIVGRNSSRSSILTSHCQSHSPIAPVDYAQFIPLTFNGELSLRLVALARRTRRRRTENAIQQPKGCTPRATGVLCRFFFPHGYTRSDREERRRRVSRVASIATRRSSSFPSKTVARVSSRGSRYIGNKYKRK